MITKCNRAGVFALTFDDGVYKYTDALLDTLKAKNVTATFFVNGYKTGDITKEPYRSVLKRMHNEGHHIGSHTYDHPDLSKLNIDGIYAQMQRNEVVFKDVLGFTPTFMRPPFGNTNTLVRQALGSWGFKIVWNNIFSQDHMFIGIRELI
jgi:peptidoglycan/xylan/chitin deacetylase (PgdA/CDA1 family)